MAAKRFGPPTDLYNDQLQEISRMIRCSMEEAQTVIITYAGKVLVYKILRVVMKIHHYDNGSVQNGEDVQMIPFWIIFRVERPPMMSEVPTWVFHWNIMLLYYSLSSYKLGTIGLPIISKGR
ncbi:hypothetical protein CHM34_12895 [Paludifilum halophilum]|uniref:Uncharacterized protein n=1 Tax=Paludifilum halophilum TaxID=1642702 RepID=A0A235B4W2_9BACL|nr:hypothetical protein CHM34_12895 [Paludifilum halophilum]